MKKNTLFYVLLQSIGVFLFFFMIELRPFDTVKNFFTKSIQNVKQNFKKSYQWLTQKETPFKEEKKIPEKNQKRISKTHPYNSHESEQFASPTISNKNNESKNNQEKINTEKKTEITESIDIKHKTENEKIDTKKKSKNKGLKKLFKRVNSEQLNNSEFRETFINKYNNYIIKKAEEEGRTLEPSSLLSSEALEKSLKHYKKKKKKDRTDNWKKKYQEKLTRKKKSVEIHTSKNSDFSPINEPIEENRGELKTNVISTSADTLLIENKDSEIEKKVKDLLIQPSTLFSLYNQKDPLKSLKEITPSKTETKKNNSTEKSTIEIENITNSKKSIINENEKTDTKKNDYESNIIKKPTKIEKIVL